jgi:predicted N-formylglutamate amidohydrolase
LVADAGQPSLNDREPYEILGEPIAGGILAVCDHASNYVPDHLNLGVDSTFLNRHIAWDIGVAGVAHYLVDISGCAAFMATHSRLVVDLNRDATDIGVVPIASDGIDIPGNRLNIAGRDARLDQYFHPYHAKLEALLHAHRPLLILSIHSFTPQLQTEPLGQRPWEIGVLYNDHEIAAMHAIDCLRAKGLIVGDQRPYSGKLLNATMNRHAEAQNIPYVGVEIRQDLIGNCAGQERFACILADMAQYVAEKLASKAAS